MATASDIAHEAKERANVLQSELELLRREIEKLSLPELRERVAVLQVQTQRIEISLEEMKQFPVLENRIKQLEDRKLLGDTRVFQSILLFIGGLLTLAINIAVSFMRK